MEFERREAPHVAATADVAKMMQQVLLALVPAGIAHVWFFGPGLIFNLVVAAAACVGGEALMMRLRGRPAARALSDYSALVTAALLAFALPSLTPWWVTATGALFGIVVAKHLYGGLGFNIFNPAMAGYVVVLIAFPMHLNLWAAPRMGDIDYQFLAVLQTLKFTATGILPDALTYDEISRATPLDAMKSGLNDMRTTVEIRSLPIMGDFGWHIPVGVGAGLLIPAGVMWLVSPGTEPSPGFHMFSGAALLCAFFIATDPVSAAASPKGRLIYGAGIGFLIYAIRTWGADVDGVAYAVLLMNMAVPAIDRLTRPRIVGHGKGIKAP